MNEKQLLTVAKMVDVTRRDAKEAGVDWKGYAFDVAKALIALALVGEYRVPAKNSVKAVARKAVAK